jgi:hypothetical protein
MAGPSHQLAKCLQKAWPNTLWQLKIEHLDCFLGGHWKDPREQNIPAPVPERILPVE